MSTIIITKIEVDCWRRDNGTPDGFESPPTGNPKLGPPRGRGTLLPLGHQPDWTGIFYEPLN